MEQRILLSVIIPCYNCEQFIIRCIASIDSPNTEILVVNDGSTDNSAALVNNYAQKHSHVRLIQKENGGVSTARNMGIEAARGEYIAFVDADDYLVPDGLVRILEIALNEKVDVIKYLVGSVANTAPQDKQSAAGKPITIRHIVGKGMTLQENRVSDYHSIDGLFRRQLLMDWNIRFKTDLALHEDDVFMGELYAVSDKVISTDLSLYRYVRSSQASSTHNVSIDKAKRLIDSSFLAVQYRAENIQRLCPAGKFPLERYKFMRYVFSAIWLMREYQIPFSAYRPALKACKQYKCYPLRYQWIKVAKFQYSVKTIGKTFLCNHLRLLQLIQKLHK